jgi:type VI protein secretion system component VasK
MASLLRFALLAAFCVSCVTGQEVEAASPASEVEVEAASPASEEEVEPEADANSDASAEKIVDSAKELSEKLGQLKALLDKKGDGADPALKARLEGLEQQLSGLGLGNLVNPEQASSPELREFLGSCVMMSLKRAGAQRPATLAALARLADKETTMERAGDFEFVRMVAVCVNEMTDDDLREIKSGKLTVLPKGLAAKAADPESKAEVLKIDAPVWAELQVVAAAMQKQLVGDSEAQRPPITQGLLAAVPVFGMIALMAWKFWEMQKREAAKQDKKQTKKHK